MAMPNGKTDAFKKTMEFRIPATPYFQDGKEYFVSETRLTVNPLKEQGYHAVYQVFGTGGDEGKYEKIKNGILASINWKIGESLRKFDDGIGEVSVSELKPVDCPFNDGVISHVMEFSTEWGNASWIILINCYDYPDDILIEMSVWTVDYAEEKKRTEIERADKDGGGMNISSDLREITKEEGQKKQRMNSIDWLWNKSLKAKEWIFELSVIWKIILWMLFLVSLMPFFFIYAIIGVLYAVLYFVKKDTVKQSAKEEPSTKLTITYDWSGIRALTQIRHLNFIKQKTEDAIREYLEKTGSKWEKGLVANYKPELLKEGITKSISQNTYNNVRFDMSKHVDFSKTVEIGNNNAGNGEVNVWDIRL